MSAFDPILKMSHAGHVLGNAASEFVERMTGHAEKRTFDFGNATTGRFEGVP